MILPEYLEKEINIYCKNKNINIINGNIPKENVQEIQDFINKQLLKDRRKTKIIEEVNSMKISNIMSGMSSDMSEYSPIEDFLYEAFKNEGLDKYCKRQFKIGSKIVDFAFPEASLVVEADGYEYHRSDKLQIEKDQERDKYLAKKGWMVLHIEGLAIRRNITLCINRVKERLMPFIKTGD